MDHRAFLAAVPAADRLALTERSNARGLRYLALHLGAILVVSVGIAAQVPFWPLLLPVQGVLLTFLFTLEHECTHQTPFASRALNEAAGYVCGAVLMLPLHWFRAFHLAHHRWTNRPGQDPELGGPPLDTWPRWIWHVSGLPFWASRVMVLARLVMGRERAPWLSDRAALLAGREARWLLVLYGLLIASVPWPLLVWLWLVPVLLGQPVLRLYLLAEHGDCPRVADMFVNTRTTLTNRIVRRLAWNMPYHVEHHVWPAVPFHALPTLHDRMRGHLGTTAPGYAAFTRAYLDRRGLLRGQRAATTPAAHSDGERPHP